ncbi:MAG: signal recognition particle receptor subunit alpha [Candidatus Babeliales bacterium]
MNDQVSTILVTKSKQKRKSVLRLLHKACDSHYKSWSFESIMFDLLTKNVASIVSRLKGVRRITSEAIQSSVADLKRALLEADVPYDVVNDFIGTVEKEIQGTQRVKTLSAEDQFMGVVYKELKKYFGEGKGVELPHAPALIMLIGLQGSGKTTSLAKLIFYLTHYHPAAVKADAIMVMSVDMRRPAAQDQVRVLTEKLGAFYYCSVEKDPVKAACEGYDVYKKGTYSYLLIDTPGSLQTDTLLLDELRRIKAAICPTYTMLVVDAMVGQESLNVARAFEQQVGFDGAMLTKVDSQTRAGAAFSFYYVLKKEIVFMGTGEHPEAIERFVPERMPDRILGRGDMKSLAEMLDRALNEQEQKKIEKAFEREDFTLDDFAQQIAMMEKLGSLRSIMRYVPAVHVEALEEDKLEEATMELNRYRVILSSMTYKERMSPGLFKSQTSRLLRVSRGSGVSIGNIKTMLNKFEQMKLYVKLFKKGNGFDVFRKK